MKEKFFDSRSGYPVLKVMHTHTRHKLSHRQVYFAFLSMMAAIRGLQLTDPTTKASVSAAVKTLPRLTEEERQNTVAAVIAQLNGQVFKPTQLGIRRVDSDDWLRCVCSKYYLPHQFKIGSKFTCTNRGCGATFIPAPYSPV